MDKHRVRFGFGVQSFILLGSGVKQAADNADQQHEDAQQHID